MIINELSFEKSIYLIGSKIYEQEKCKDLESVDIDEDYLIFCSKYKSIVYAYSSRSCNSKPENFGESKIERDEEHDYMKILTSYICMIHSTTETQNIYVFPSNELGKEYKITIDDTLLFLKTITRKIKIIPEHQLLLQHSKRLLKLNVKKISTL
ncbi:hypothetical protein MKS88_004744 [Plasmodium brasilianum]|uniref:Uncharacterized protein n=1 Tax=Plasmodium brasilianum TaxID=5824 RepID=A0ACB9Y2D4_PLABR|nr:hypothetical protein MKS88_004744 [Plasmodium brasilianum]